MENNGSAAAAAGGFGIFMLVELAIVVFMIVAAWKVYTKAGRPGWACIIPFYNAYVMLEMAGKPGWWLVLFLIPVVNFVIAIIAMIALAERFGKGAGFGLGLVFLPIIFIPILAFGSAAYKVAAPAPAPAT
jgi:hypothetical protein